MLVPIEEYGVCAEITGFREIQIDSIKKIAELSNQSKKRNATLQFLDAQCIATWEHLHFAVLHALLAFRNRCNISRSLGVEILLYASAQRQIKKAIDLVGVKSGCLDLAVVIVDRDEAATRQLLDMVGRCFERVPDESVLGLSKKKREVIQSAFGISEAELYAVSKPTNPDEALLNMVTEKMALLVTQL
jgi:KEOPS complex subunit Cgi121